MSVLTSGQVQFRNRLAAKTGLNAGVITAWMLSEESGSAARSRQGASNHNWLNIAYYDSGPGSITRGREWRTPQGAADATALFLKGKKYGPSPGIRQIIRTAGRPASSQISAIAGSGWASSGYEGGSTLTSLYHQYGAGVKQPSAAPAAPVAPAPSTSGGTTPFQTPPGGSTKTARLLGLQAQNNMFDLGASVAGIKAINPLRSVLSRQLAAENAGATSTAPATAAPVAPAAPAGGKFGYQSGTPQLSHPTIQAALRKIAGQYGHTLTVGTTTNHSKMTTSGNISDHWSGNAADIPASGSSLTKMGQAALVALGKPRSWALQQQGGLYNINKGGKRYQVIFNTTQGGNHWNHLHVGVQ